MGRDIRTKTNDYEITRDRPWPEGLAGYMLCAEGIFLVDGLIDGFREPIALHPPKTLAPHRLGMLAGPLANVHLHLMAPAADLDAVRELLARVCHTALGSGQLDLTSGITGLLIALHEFESMCEQRLVDQDLRHRLEARLCAGAETLLDVEEALLGAAHGYAGFLAAFSVFDSEVPVELGDAFVDELWSSQRTDETLSTWPTAEFGDESGFFHGWCHGGPGILMGLAAWRPHSQLDDIDQLIGRAIAGTEQVLSSVNSLCCGNLARVAALQYAGMCLDRPELFDRAAAVFAACPLDRGYFGKVDLFKGSAGQRYVEHKLATRDGRFIGFPSHAGRS